MRVDDSAREQLRRWMARLPEGRERFLVASGSVATLCGALGCVLYGLSGVLGLVAGLALISTPVLVLRRA